MSELNIYQRLSLITNELERVAKNLSVGAGNSSYKAVGEADILKAVKPLEDKHGVYSYPLSRDVISYETLTTEKTYNSKTTKSTKFMMRVKTTYRFVNIDNPSEFVDQDSFGDGVDSLDKAPGKAMTYSDKYSLMKAYKIMTGDDPDQKHSNDTQVTGTYQKGKISQYHKDQIINAIQDNLVSLDKIKAGYEVTNLDELSFDQGKSISEQVKSLRSK